MANAADSKSAVARLVGSTPTSGTKQELFENLDLPARLGWHYRKRIGS
jgi:hypothetical protein